MNEREAEDFLLYRGWPVTPLSEGECRCSPPSWSDPTGEVCGPCEARADERYEAEQEAAFWDELEFERDAAFEALIEARS